MAHLILAGLVGLAALQPCSAASLPSRPTEYCPVFYSEAPGDCLRVPESFLNLPTKTGSSARSASGVDVQILEDAFDALVVLQDSYFDTNFGAWPLAIDWTTAVTETVIAGMLTTLTKTLATFGAGDSDWKAKENLISYYYAQVVAAYFGQDIISLRGQAYDDMQWVVLGWIEAINFVQTHSELHYPVGDQSGTGLQHALDTLPWHGNNWVNAFAHRARVFWNLASVGYDEQLCHGGMLWNKDQPPYKNAITNELWVASSISMYQYFPGDNFTSPWLAQDDTDDEFPSKDPIYLAAADEGYTWLKNVGLMNEQGLFADGFHINSSIPGNVECDVRDEMVYTYNQGVILTGHRGLYVTSGSVSYLEAGHKLIQAVINATGWSLQNNAPIKTPKTNSSDPLPPWQGLGRGGIMEEECDASGTCSQDGQTFKGIYFHHLTAFCAPLEIIPAKSGVTVDERAFDRAKTAHATACSAYLGWVAHNAKAALTTRVDGKFGMWWGANVFNNVFVEEDNDGIDHSAKNSTDYRNKGTPDDDIWGGAEGRWEPGMGGSDDEMLLQTRRANSKRRGSGMASGVRRGSEDPNDRGEGRTVETQVGGLAVLRAHWELSQLSEPV